MKNFKKKLIKICDENQYQKTVDLSARKNSKKGKKSNLREVLKLLKILKMKIVTNDKKELVTGVVTFCIGGELRRP